MAKRLNAATAWHLLLGAPSLNKIIEIAENIANHLMPWYSGAMMRIFFRHKLAMVMLLLAAFVVIPVADEVLCAFEGGDTYSYVETHSDDNRDNGFDFDFNHADCSHGHCHHTHAHIPPNYALKIISLHLAHQRPDNDAVASHTSDGLIRPPKA